MHLPIDVAEHTFLTDLSLRDNAIVVLPPSVGDIIGLYTLRLDSNYLSMVPPELGKLSGLTELGIGRNLLQHFPDELLLNFQNLRVLDLAYNQLRSMPSSVCALSRLTDLDLSNNSLPTLPFEMCRLTNLTRLRLHRNVLRLPLKDLADQDDIGGKRDHSLCKCAIATFCHTLRRLLWCFSELPLHVYVYSSI